MESDKGYIRNNYYIEGSTYPEQFIHRALSQICGEVINKYSDSRNEYQYDIVVPSANMRIVCTDKLWRTSRVDNQREEMRRQYCEINSINFIEIVQDNEVNGVVRNKKGYRTVYRYNTSGDLFDTNRKLKVIISEICKQFGLEVINGIDFERVIYEALLFSCQHQYQVTRTEYREINGFKYVEASE